MQTTTQEEKEYLQQYDITKYDRPSIAADIAIFTILAAESTATRDKANYRRRPATKLKILLIKRSAHPYRGQWALPGGFCRRGEEIIDAARRELAEETQIKNARLQLAGIFGQEGRDPRGWVISHTHIALLDGNKCSLKAGSDAQDARWFEVTLTQEPPVRQESAQNEPAPEKPAKQLPQNPHTTDQQPQTTTYRLTLTNNETTPSLTLQAKIREEKTLASYQIKTTHTIEETDGLAFDHAKIITHALLHLRRQAETDGRIVFDLMPEAFTLTGLQNACEIILGKKLLPANFRRKMAPYVTETSQKTEGAGHRPAKLYTRTPQSIFLE